MVEYGLSKTGPMAAGVGFIALGVILLSGGILLELLAGGQTGVSFLALGPLCLGFGVYLVWQVSNLRDQI